MGRADSFDISSALIGIPISLRDWRDGKGFRFSSSPLAHSESGVLKKRMEHPALPLILVSKRTFWVHTIAGQTLQTTPDRYSGNLLHTLSRRHSRIFKSILKILLSFFVFETRSFPALRVHYYYGRDGMHENSCRATVSSYWIVFNLLL